MTLTRRCSFLAASPLHHRCQEWTSGYYGALHAQYHHFREKGLSPNLQPLLAHWPGCQFCKPRHTSIMYDAVNCTSSFMEAYKEVSSKTAVQLSSGLGMKDWGINIRGISNLTTVGWYHNKWLPCNASIC